MPPRHIRKAFTLLELTIAMAIFSMLMVCLLESWSSMSRYASFAQVQDDLTIEGKRIVQDLKFDLSQSGWYLPDGTTASSKPSAAGSGMCGVVMRTTGRSRS